MQAAARMASVVSSRVPARCRWMLMVRRMKSRPPKELIWLTSAALMALALSVAVLGLRHGVRHDSNSGSLLGMLFMAGGALVTAAGLATLFGALVSWRASTPAWRWSGVVVALLALGAPWQSFRALHCLAGIAERRDFEEAHPGQLRLAVKELVLSAAHKDYTQRWFGGEVPAHEVPPVIHRFIPGAAYVTVDEHGIVMVTDGLGAWRGGYMITPPGSDFVPPNSRRITDGFYYVTSNGGP